MEVVQGQPPLVGSTPTAGVLPGVKSDRKVKAIHKAERNPQSLLRQPSRACQHSDASLQRDAVLPRPDSSYLVPFFSSMSYYLCAPVDRLYIRIQQPEVAGLAETERIVSGVQLLSI